ncbi:Pycsar system effector family protein [Sphingobium sp. AN641]|uniref:Pycsar system effector family protein n=1 Tax=Sphingobium sp. AN641 TaxID=3133443 RepID=UPI0030BF5C77
MSKQHTENDAASAALVPPEIGNAPRLEPPPSSMPSLEPMPTNGLDLHHAEFASFHEDYVRHYIALADTKAGVCFGVMSAVVGYLVSQDKVQAFIVAPACTAQFGIVASALLFLIVAAGCAFAVIAPRLDSVTGESIVFFGAVAKRKSGDDYIREIAARSESEMTAIRLKHCFDVSKVCSRKYAFLKAAIWLALPGLALALLATLIL